uniref:Metalloendopeptidase n=1 Tax=Strongyloides papillosus TaxID=174720 RepID=A0A0N5BL85_STREA
MNYFIGKGITNDYYKDCLNKKMFLPFLFSLISLSIAFESEDNIYLRRDKRTIEIKHNFNYSNPMNYFIGKGITNDEAIKKALLHLEHYTCLHFKESDSELKNDGINFEFGNELSVSGEKYKDKLSFVYLTKDCMENIGCMKHMLGHIFGLNHETARYDRYKYVKIYWDRIDNKSKSTFQRDNGYNTRIFNTAFDYGSIMMPPLRYGTKNNQKAYETLESPYYENMVGQREEYSHNDLKKINDVYCGGLCVRKAKNCKHGSYPSPDCGVCNCPLGYAGKTCTALASSFGNCGHTSLSATRKVKTLVLKGHVKCIIAINSKAGTNVAITVKSMKTDKFSPCVEGRGLEVKYRHDKGATGLCLCGSYKNVPIPPTFSAALVMFHGNKDDHELHLTYQEVKRKKIKY